MIAKDKINTLKAKNNRTLTLSNEEQQYYSKQFIKINKKIIDCSQIYNKIINQDLFECLDFLPANFVDLVFIDPPYNLNKKFNDTKFKEMNDENYEQYLDSFISKIAYIMKEDASIYICGDWRSSAAIYNVIKKYFIIQNRITFEREKGRGAKSNWKNCSEDIWFCTKSKDYYFNVDAVKIKRRVLAPYKNEGQPKDWEATNEGNFRLTYPSNIWTDITIPFWSMAENTDHPTQKPEKLLAKIILASSKSGDVIFDPFLGSGTTAVVAKKTNRNYIGIELDEIYCCYSEKRLKLAEADNSIQGFSDGVFWERNSL